jgi:phosphoribosylaminoimidazolecarboxamide formyltransferase/IMP cyclohydrolase
MMRFLIRDPALSPWVGLLFCEGKGERVRALISVWDKRGVEAFAAGLQALGIELFSTGNTARRLAEAGIKVQSVSTLTGFPEILDGRVKTLHPAVHGGILARRDLPEHMQALAEHNISPIDLVVVNLYPFAETIARPAVTRDDAIEQIDIGGPAMVRAAAKNHQHVLVLVSPDDYEATLVALREDHVTPEMRRHLAARAFAHTAAYDATIAGYLGEDPFPETLPLAFHKAQDLRYGENPHQRAALYGDFGQFFEQLHGKELSYINILDIAAVQELIEEFAAAEGAALAIVKHTNPCGVGLGATPLEAWEHAYATDREAPFGGIIAVNQMLDLPLAQAIDAIFSEIIIAPSFADEAFDLLRRKKNRRLMRAVRPVTGGGTVTSPLLIHSVPGGVLAQQPDRAPLADEPLQVVTKRAPTEQELRALGFGWRVAKHVKSNAIVYAAADRTLGIGAGQMSRVDSSRLAIWKAQNAGLALAGSAVASDALFPFPDGVEAAAAAGATAVIQPGGSMRDDEVIAAADRLGLAMVFTGRRHFKH